MDYCLDALSDRQFERLSQVLAHKVIGPGLSVFGDGPDGGREATWRGSAPSLDEKANWNGYGVLQAKKCEHPSTNPVDNERWFRKVVKKELLDWAKVESNRGQKPDYLILSTNVRLSPFPGAGIDRAILSVQEMIDELELPILGFRIWHYDEIQVMLDSDPSIYARFAAWITPGDVIARLISDGIDKDQAFTKALRAHAARSFLDDNYLNLTQAGTVSDTAVSVSDVFIDLPFELETFHLNQRGFEHDATVPPEFLGGRSSTSGGMAEYLIEEANQSATENSSMPEDPKSNRSVLVGGPGQGKSTITQFLAQVYRAEFIRDTPSATEPDIAKAVIALDRRMQTLGIDRPRARRWPIRVILTDLADALEKKECDSLLEFITSLIQRRSGSPLSVEALRVWLSAYPWMMLIDGLDEVPSSSNRTQVMRAIKDFYIEVATAEGDVSTIATTRPQGYNHEFSPEYYRHFALDDLPYATAMKYAEGLVSIRSGAGTESARRTMRRLQRATEEEATAHLFASPLQVTILTVLIERLGQAPRDRWRLFSDYYRVIYQREQEKGGALARLLQDHQSDVNYIHRHLGHLLQQRSTQAGETSSFVSKKDLDAVIRRRLAMQGHEEEEVDRLANEFNRLIVERLVFLALLSADRVGFELRSFQEFMAAEYIVGQPEHKVLQAVKEIAPLSHWRNVVLFALGQIFAEKDHLKGDAVQLFEQLNWELEHSNVLQVGSDLALDVLLDGSCHSQPIYARPLAERAALLLDGPLSERYTALGRLKEGQVGRIIRSRAMAPSPQSLSAKLNRIRFLTTFFHDDDAKTHVAQICSNLTNRELDLAVDLALSREDKLLMEVLETHLEGTDPSVVLSVDSSFFTSIDDAIEISSGQSRPLWLAVEKLRRFLSVRGNRVGTDDGVLGTRAFTLHTGADEWNDVAGFVSSTGRWQIVASIAAFVSNPCEATMAAALGVAATLENPELLSLAPWPLASCYASAANLAATTGSKQDAGTWLKRLSELASEGVLGNPATWLEAESAWDATSATSLLRDSMLGSSRLKFDESGKWTIPIGSTPSAMAESLLGRVVVAGQPRRQEQLDEISRLSRDLLVGLKELDADDASLARYNIGLFLAHLAAAACDNRWRERKAGVDVHPLSVSDASELREAIVSACQRDSPLSGREPLVLGWARLFRGASADQGAAEVVRSFGGVRALRFYFTPVEANPEWLTNMRLFPEDEWKRLRFLAHINMEALAGSDPGLLRSALDHIGTSPVEKKFASFLRLCLSKASEVQRGVVDEDIKLLCCADAEAPLLTWEADSVNRHLVHRLIYAKDPVQAMSLSAKCAEHVSPINPIWGQLFADLSKEMSDLASA